MTLTFGSVCSGIEAASVAWEPLGWRAAWFAEIEPFPSAVLAQRFPGVPNLGDMTTIAARILDGHAAAPDVLVGGTPCQSFSIAGLRKGLADDRGNLALEFIRLGDAIDSVRRAAGKPPAFILWENVPGVLSDTGNAFGTFLAGLVGSNAAIAPRGRWTDAGVVHGPGRCAAWRILDAQHHALAQRRERVFVLARAGARGWTAADALLPIIEGVRWHPAPRREAGKGIAGALATRPDRGGVNSEGADGKLIPQIAGAIMPSPSRNRSPNEDATLLPELATTLRARDAKQTPDSDCTATLVPELANTLGAKKDGGWRGDLDHDTYVADVARCLTNHSARIDGESETFIAQVAVQGIAHTLTTSHRSTEDGSGRGTPLVPVAAPPTAGGHPNSNAPGRRKEDDTNLVAHAFDARQSDVIQYGNMSRPLDTDGGSIGVLAFAQNQRDEVRQLSVAGALAADPGMKQQTYVATVEVADTLAVGANQTTGMPTECVGVGMAVRRLTPRECERLQGFPDDHTLIVYRGKPAADGPRYRALGNSMAVPVMRAIGHGIANTLKGADRDR